ncbi:helix-turn-helix domain-containing protein [Colwellia psychrerythraea]|uniref:Transcriptional regulator, AraC family n=1 Tax=Colwellia psychrerythraea (strain 34H / ATCC BAA-681) TaxID=167879 RepID=Q47V73_COLP3|nr:helix-turn-helix domain-containing protein [Colwellia psychrerythraea]AAZ25132.1 transcriptional regulator, AraC family [Colwellia psychrerythraea 34H]
MNIPKVQFNPKVHKNIGIEIIELSDIYKRSDDDLENFIAKPHRIKFHNILYITQGRGTHFIDFNTYTTQAGSVVFINKNQVHAFDLINQPQGKLIIFTDEYLDTILTTIKTPLSAHNYLLTSYSPTFSLSKKIRNTCDVLLTEIEKEYQVKDPNLNFLNLIFSAVLTKLSSERTRSFEQYLSESRTEKFMTFIELLEVNYTNTRDAKIYADMLHMTYKSLNQICKLATKQTTKQLIDAYIILEAKRKLSIENIRVQQLADELGFDEVTNFVKYFKKNTLLTPSQFKKLNQG